MENFKTFFSYSRTDSEFALKVATDLKEANANIWIDQLNIIPGKKWDAEIEKALTTSECMLVILSPESVVSDNVLDEISFAIEKKKTVIPILFRECEIPFRIKRYQYIDFSKNYDNGIKQLIRALNNEEKGQTKIINTLKEPQIEEKFIDKEDENLWTEAQNKGTIEGYEEYLSKYSSGKYQTEALRSIKILENVNTQKKAAEREDTLWQKAREINSVSSYREYLDKAELRVYRDQANKLMEEIEKKNETSFWQNAKSQDSINVYEDYLEKYPEGMYVSEAADIIRNLEAAMKEEAYKPIRLTEEDNRQSSEEYSSWKQAEQDNTINSYNKYLDKYPASKNREQALAAIKIIEDKNKYEIVTKPENSSQSEKGVMPGEHLHGLTSSQLEVRAEEYKNTGVLKINWKYIASGIALLSIILFIIFLSKLTDKKDKGTLPDTTKVANSHIGNSSEETIRLDNVSPLLLPRPPFIEFLSSSSKKVTPLDINLASVKVGNLNKEFAFDSPAYANPDSFFHDTGIQIPRTIPRNYNNEILMKGWHYTDYQMFLYGKDVGENSHYLLITDASTHKVLHFLDFSNYLYPPKYRDRFGTLPKESYCEQIRWVEIKDNILYVCNAMDNDAYDSFGMDAYISAIDLSDHKLLWRSKPLVASGNFELFKDYIICGYGFQGQPNFLYVLNKDEGATMQKIHLKSHPGWVGYIFRKENKLYVPVYNAYFTFNIN